MSIKAKTPKDTNIKLYVMRSNEERPYTVDEKPYVTVDITDQILDKVDRFGIESIIGVEYNYGDNIQDAAFLREWNLHRNIVTEMESLLDAILVNEKQKVATKNIMYEKIDHCFKQANMTFDFAKELTRQERVSSEKKDTE